MFYVNIKDSSGAGVEGLTVWVEGVKYVYTGEQYIESTVNQIYLNDLGNGNYGKSLSLGKYDVKYLNDGITYTLFSDKFYVTDDIIDKLGSGSGSGSGGDIEDQVITNTGNIVTIQSDISGIEASIGNLQQSNSYFSSQITNINGTLGNHTTRLNEIEENMSDLYVDDFIQLHELRTDEGSIITGSTDPELYFPDINHFRGIAVKWMSDVEGGGRDYAEPQNFCVRGMSKIHEYYSGGQISAYLLYRLGSLEDEPPLPTVSVEIYKMRFDGISGAFTQKHNLYFGGLYSPIMSKEDVVVPSSWGIEPGDVLLIRVYPFNEIREDLYVYGIGFTYRLSPDLFSEPGEPEEEVPLINIINEESGDMLPTSGYTIDFGVVSSD